MKRKLIITGLTCVSLLVSGICYSCSYQQKQQAELVTGTPEDGTGFAAQEATDLTGQQAGSRQAADGQDKSLVEEQDLGLEADKAKMDNLTGAGQTSPETMLTGIPEGTGMQSVIYVHVCGAVVHPGVYATAADARIVDVLELAGGLAEEAAGDYLNQAQQILDGQRIYVPTKSEVSSLTAGDHLNGGNYVTGGSYVTGGNYAAGGEAAVPEGKDSSLVNINTADVAQLMTLPGIGQSKADRIIEYRSANGKFKTIEELMKVPGIKEGSFRQISLKISVD